MMTNPPALVVGAVGLLLLRRVPLLILIFAAALTTLIFDFIMFSEHWERLGIQRDHLAAFLRYCAGFGIVLSIAQVVRIRMWGDQP
ncbi:MAG: hypothetical protein C0524_16300 [Rhodobacter sp.]|nr:hypothetical protein [Rhodobacter sp.]